MRADMLPVFEHAVIAHAAWSAAPSSLRREPSDVTSTRIIDRRRVAARERLGFSLSSHGRPMAGLMGRRFLERFKKWLW